ncbi:hypothetical protein M3Y99_01180300 [Aphelenchoides fujianensis]|nr:hypothetical protein M3Y99_01180300 [Aphelenchoides fujianensis]
MNKFVDSAHRNGAEGPVAFKFDHRGGEPTDGRHWLPQCPPAAPQQQPMMSGFVPGVPPPQLLPTGSVYQAPAAIPTSFLVTSQARPLGFQPAAYTQPTPHGMIPAGWKIDEPVQRLRHPPPPERQILPKLPFKDFSQA